MPLAPLAMLLFAQSAAASPAAYGPAAAAAAPTSRTVERECAPQAAPANPNEIVVCAVKPQGFRIDPDVLTARKMKKEGNSGRPRNPHETFADHSCANVGPMGCRGTPAINLVNVAMTAANISERLAKGEEVGSVFVTDPHPTEYQLYQEAKRQRQAKEAQAAAARVKAAAEAREAAQSARP
ncbi:MAG: hypothetical protein ACJ8E0_03020 [Sphingomicrobium sp.]